MSEAAVRRFQAVNEGRLLRLLNSLGAKQQLLVDALPLLLHLNHPRLPGHVDQEEVAGGIAGYAPSEATLRAVAELAPRFDYKPARLRGYDIEALFLLDRGKDATGGRHLDLWTCHREGVEPRALRALAKKLERLRRRFGEVGVELRAELFTAAALRSGEALGVGWINRPPARDHLLLEEFYLSSVHLAGAHPLWWRVPPEEEANYDACAARLTADATIAADTIDFGGIEAVEPEEFFRTVLWRFYAELATPCQSLPELLLMELYTSEFPRPKRLSSRLKRAIYAGDMKPAQLDTLALMAERLRDYLTGPDEAVRLERLKRCLRQRLDPERTAGRDRPLTKLRDEALRLAATVSRAYAVITEIAQREAQRARIDPMELILLGRRLYAAFDPRGDRVEWINPGLAGELVQGALSFHHRDRGAPWRLHQGLVAPTAEAEPIKSGKSPLELLAWAWFNGLVDDSTTLALHPGEIQLGPREMQGALAALAGLFPGGRPVAPEPAELAHPSMPSIQALFVNFATPSASLMSRGDQQVISDHADPFRFGAMQENLIATIDLVTVTTWGEVHTQRFQGRHALINCIKQFIQAVARPELLAPPTLAAYCFSSAQGAIISRRMEELFNTLSARCAGKAPRELPGYILALGRGYALIRMEREGPTARYADTPAKLLAELARPRDRHTRWWIDPQALRDTPLPAILHRVEPGMVQLYHQNAGRDARLYVLDERGTLFCTTTPRHGGPAHYRRFLTDTLRRLFLWRPLAHSELEEDELRLGGGDDRPFTGELECKRLEARADGGFEIVDAQEEEEETAPGLQLVVQTEEKGHAYTVYFGDQIHSGASLDEVIRSLAETDPGAARLESIDAPPEVLGAESPDALQTLHYLRFKSAFDARLRAATAKP